MGLRYLAYLSSGEYLAGCGVAVLPPQWGHFSLREYLPQSTHFNIRLFNVAR